MTLYKYTSGTWGKGVYMTKVIDPAKLSGTLKILALDAAKAEKNKELIDTNYEIGLFENHARHYLNNGIATDYTEDDLNNVLGIKKEEPKKEESAVSKQEKTNPYKEEFAELDSQQLAEKMFEQISGFSSNQKTLDMYDAIPDDKLGETVIKYNTRRESNYWKEFFGGETSNPDIKNKFYNHYDSMFYAMNDEWGMKLSDIKPRIEKLINLVSTQQLNEKQKCALEYAKLLLKNAQGDKFEKETICLIENNLAIAMNSKPKYKKEGILGTDFFQRWTMDYSKTIRVNESLEY